MSMGDNRLCRLTAAMIEFFAGDPKRIQHFLKVRAFADIIADGEGLQSDERFTLSAAALVHDIGIKPAEERYGKGVCGGKLQEELGPEPAAKMLKALGFDKELVERVCFLVGHHHTYKGVDSLDWQILIEADFLVNAYDDYLSKEAITNFREKIFKTKTGIKALNDTFGFK